MLKLAMPPESAALPIWLPPSEKLIVPVGELPVTLAVNVTLGRMSWG